MALFFNQELSSKNAPLDIARLHTNYDFQPEVGELVIFKNERGKFAVGMYNGMWNDVRASRNDGKFESSPYLPEQFPYCGNEENHVFRAKVNHVSQLGRNEWFIGNFFDYADIGYIMEFTRENLYHAIELNRLAATLEAKEVEAVA